MRGSPRKVVASAKCWVIGVVQLDRSVRVEPSRDLVGAARDGDEGAWADIYRQFIGPITGYLARSGVTEADDVAAEVFLQVARDIHRYDPDGGSFRSWVFVIAHRRMIDWRRAAGRRLPASPSTPEDQPGGDVEQEAMELLEASDWSGILDILTEEQREVLTLRLVADMSLLETAEVTGRRVGAVKALQHRGLEAMRRAMDEGRLAV